jgi:hypothetical protein
MYCRIGLQFCYKNLVEHSVGQTAYLGQACHGDSDSAGPSHSSITLVITHLLIINAIKEVAKNTLPAKIQDLVVSC